MASVLNRTTNKLNTALNAAPQTKAKAKRAMRDMAAAMGLEEGDVITHINRQMVPSAAEARTLAKGSNGNVMLRVWRKGDTMLLMIGNN